MNKLFKLSWKLLGRSPIKLSQNSIESLNLVNNITGWNFKENERFNQSEVKLEDENFTQSLREMTEMHPSPLGVNSSKEHAIEVFTALVDNAQHELKIYDRDISGDLLNEEHVNNLKSKFQNFVKSGNNKRIVILAPVAGKNDQLINDLENIAPGKISVVLIPDQLENQLSSVIPFYFAVNDCNSFRIEKRRDTNDPSREARFAFNDENVGRYLNETFDDIKEKLSHSV